MDEAKERMQAMEAEAKRMEREQEQRDALERMANSGRDRRMTHHRMRKSNNNRWGLAVLVAIVAAIVMFSLVTAVGSRLL